MGTTITPLDDAFGARAIDVNSIGLRVAPLDVGFDLRVQGMLVAISDDTTIASYATRKGKRFVVEGTAEEICAELKRHGYRCEVRVGGK